MHVYESGPESPGAVDLFPVWLARFNRPPFQSQSHRSPLSDSAPLRIQSSSNTPRRLSPPRRISIGIGSRALHHSTIRTQTQSQNQTQSQSHAQASPLPDPGLCRHCCRPPQRLQLQQAGDEWGRWEWRVLSVYPEEEADPILDLHTHAMNVHKGFGSVSNLCPSVPEADRRSGEHSRERPTSASCLPSV